MTHDHHHDDNVFDLAALDTLGNDALWEIVHSQLSAGDVTRLVWLLEEHADNALNASERAELQARSAEAEHLLRRRAHAAAVLQQRGYSVPPIDEM